MSRVSSWFGTSERPASESPPAPAGLPSDHSFHVLTELERLLREAGCPVCRHAAEVERSYFAWFAIESYTTVETQARLRDALGMCPTHSRRLIDELGDGHIMTVVMRQALAGARQALTGDHSPASCPACDVAVSSAQRATDFVLKGLLDAAKARAYSEHVGVCAPHMLQAVKTAVPSTLRLLAERLLESLGQANENELVELLAGVDRDVACRGFWRARLSETAPSDSTLTGLCDRLSVQACPVCMSAGLIDRHYVHWFLERCREHDPSIRSDPGELCSAHTHDAAFADRAAARDAITRKKRTRIGQLQRLLDRLAELPSPDGRGRRQHEDDLERARAELSAANQCPACHARGGTEDSQLGLVIASLALTPIRNHYERSHGLCARHALGVGGGEPHGMLTRHAAGRLGVLAWEVEETARKYAWSYRHEDSGPEQAAWLRALAQIDGRVFEGGPPLVGANSWVDPVPHQNR